MNKDKIKSLLDKSKNLESVMLQKHDTSHERMKARQQMKQKIDQTGSGKEYVICVFEI
jgi:hypothetical protein